MSEEIEKTEGQEETREQLQGQTEEQEQQTEEQEGQAKEPEKDIEAEFVEASCKMVKDSIGYHIERNVPRILDDMQSQQELTGENTLSVTIKATFWRPSAHSLKITDCVVSYVQKRQYKDGDFIGAKVDLDQPLLPGFEDAEKDADAETEAEETEDRPRFLGTNLNDSLEALLDAAERNNRAVLFCCMDPSMPNYQRTIHKFSGVKDCLEVWKTAMVPRTREEILRIAEGNGDYCVDETGVLTDQSILNLLEDGEEVNSIGGLSYSVSEVGGLGYRPRISNDVSQSFVDTKGRIFKEIVIDHMMFCGMELTETLPIELKPFLLSSHAGEMTAVMSTSGFAALKRLCQELDCVLLIYPEGIAPEYYLAVLPNCVLQFPFTDSGRLQQLMLGIGWEPGRMLDQAIIIYRDMIAPNSVKLLNMKHVKPSDIIGGSKKRWTPTDLSEGLKLK